MSAIWGKISFENMIEEQYAKRMQLPYEKKCVINRFQSICEGKAYIACGLQYITKEAKAEELPIYNKQKDLFFTADCVLDNREELTALLQAQPGLPDGTLMYLAYLKWGIDCLKRFRGLFSLAVYDRFNDVLYLAADQVASRCLYYYVTPQSATFSTLLQPILKVNEGVMPNTDYLTDYLVAPGMMPSIVAEETPYKGVYKMKPGTYVEITKGRAQEHCYHEIADGIEGTAIGNATECGEQFRKLFQNCVASALRCEGEVAVSLSSGLDSASVGGVAARELHKEGGRLFSYTYVPAEKNVKAMRQMDVMDETKDVLDIVKMHFNIVPHFSDNHGKNCVEDMDEGMEIMEIPYKAYVNIPSLLDLYRNAYADGCRVVLTGQCGNSTISHGYIDDVLYDLFDNKHYATFVLWLNHYSKVVGESRKKALRNCISYFRYTRKKNKNPRFVYKLQNPYVSKQILNGYPLKQRFIENHLTVLENLPSGQKAYHNQLCSKAMYAYLGELDTKLGLAAGVLLRDPTRDIRMLSFCYHMPYKYFAYQGIPRWLIRSQMRDILPTGLLDQWMRYGVQNADWHVRLERDWNQVLPRLVEKLRKEELPFPVDMDKLEEYFLNNQIMLSPQESDNTSFVLFLYNMQLFLETYHVVD